MMQNLDQLVEDQLNLQVKISYGDHHAFLLRHGLKDCQRVLDVGTGNGSFVHRLAQDHPDKEFVGIDKRPNCIESCQKFITHNLSFSQVDMFARHQSFDFSQFDGLLMRYFLLHVDHAHKILEVLKTKTKRPARFWIIDLDYSQFRCTPESEGFDKLQKLVEDFCAKKSLDTLAGKRILPMLKEMGYANIQTEHIPFSTHNMPLKDLTLYLKQEMLCYSRMSGRALNDPETHTILNFLDQEVSSGRFQIDYGMILLSAELI